MLACMIICTHQNTYTVVVPLNDLHKQCRSILNWLWEDLQQVTIVIKIHQDVQSLQLYTQGSIRGGKKQSQTAIPLNSYLKSSIAMATTLTPYFNSKTNKFCEYMVWPDIYCLLMVVGHYYLALHYCYCDYITLSVTVRFIMWDEWNLIERDQWSV